MLLLLLLELRRGTRTLNGTESASRLLTVVLALDGATLLPSEDGFALDIVGFKILDVISLADGLNQHAHLIWELRDKDHGLEVRGDGAFGCCHPGETDKNGVDGECGIGVPGDDNVHRYLELFVCGGYSGFTIGGLEILPGYGSEHRGDIGILLNSLLEEIQDGCGDGWMEAKHNVPQSLVVNVEPRVNFRLVLGGLGNIRNCLGFGTIRVQLGDGGCGFVVGSGELICDDLPLALREKVVHHHRPPGLPVHRTVQDGDERHERRRHVLILSV